MAPTGEWRLVQYRRRRYPESWKTSPTNPTPNPQTKPLSAQAKPYTPFLNKPTYAQALLSSVRPSPPSPNTTPPRSQASSPPISLNSSHSTSYYVSPHSPTHLHFPPSSTFAEWRGRCFKCCRAGHTKAACRNKHRCGKCWQEGHVGNRCTVPDLNPAARPTATRPKPEPLPQAEPLFDDILATALPLESPYMLPGRPFKTLCFVHRDEPYFQEVKNLNTAVVLHTHEESLDLSIDQVASYAVRTGLVSRAEISIAKLTRGKYLIKLPNGMAPETFIRATPYDLWDFGFSFQPWTPLADAAIVIPSYRVVLAFEGLPIQLWREDQVRNAVSQFGTYLGSITQPNPADYRQYLAVVAIDNLERIPQNVGMMVGGLEHLVPIKAIKIVTGTIYKASDLPILPRQFTIRDVASPDVSSGDEQMWDDNELIPMSKRVIREICQGMDIVSIPPELRRIVAGEDPPTAQPKSPQTTNLATENPPYQTLGDTQNQLLSQLPLRILTRSTCEAGHHTEKSTTATAATIEGPQPTEHEQRTAVQGRTEELTVENTRRVDEISHADKTPKKKAVQEDSSGSARNSKKGKAGDTLHSGDKSTGEMTLSDIRTGARQKRKSALENKAINRAGPSKKPTMQITGSSSKKDDDKADCDLNASGFYEIKVQYAHSLDLAKRCGVQPNEVARTIQEDNQARNATQPDDFDYDMDPRRFEPDSEDDLGSDLE